MHGFGAFGKRAGFVITAPIARRRSNSLALLRQLNGTKEDRTDWGLHQIVSGQFAKAATVPSLHLFVSALTVEPVSPD